MSEFWLLMTDTGQPSLGESVEERQIEPSDYYLKVIWKRKGLIIGGTFVTAAAALLFSVFMTKIYEARVTLLVTESKVPSVETGRPMEAGLSVGTFEGMVRNQSLAEKAIERFSLNQDPYNLTPEGFLRSVLSVKAQSQTNLINLTVEFSDARLARDIANFIAEQAVTLNTQLNRADTVKTRDYIKTQRDDARVKMEQAQDELVRFQREARLATLRKEVELLLVQKTDVEQKYLNALTSIEGDRAELKELSALIAKQQKVETIVKSIEKEPGLLIAAEEHNPGPKRDLLSLQMKSEELNPVYMNTEEALVETRGRLASLEARRDDLIQRLGEIKKKLAEAEMQLTNKDARLEELTRNYTLLKDAYQLFAKKSEETSLSVASRVNDLKILDWAVIPRDPAKPRIILNVALAGTLGLMMFTFLAFLLEYLTDVGKGKSS